jgi:hypothetical protein
MPRYGKHLKEQSQRYGSRKTYQALRENFETGRMDRNGWSLREMAESFLGDGWEEKLRRHRTRPGFGELNDVALTEGTEAMDASNFAAISGQLLIDRVRDKYQLATQIGDQMFDVDKITHNLGTHIEPYMSRVKNKSSIVNQGMPYPATSFEAGTFTYPAPRKRGDICRLSMEMIFADRTNQARQTADSVGTITGVDVELERMAVAIGIINNHTWNDTAYNTYLTTGAWVNAINTFTFNDWNDWNAITQLFTNMVDIGTGLPIQINPTDVFVMPAKLWNTKRILNATEVRVGNITSGAGTQTVGPNPIAQAGMNPLTSPYARQVAINGIPELNVSGAFTAAQADTIMLAGEFKKAFVWREVYPLQLTTAPPMSPAEFEADIVLQVKASVFGVAAVRDPRYVFRGYNSNA